MQTSSTAPRQTRSRLTQARLLNAALSVLDREGLEATTVPRIAAAAGLSPASLYRRFADKEDLLRTAFLGMLQTTNSANAEQLPALVARPTLQLTVGALVEALLRQYRDHPRLLAALKAFIQSAPDSDFAREARQRIARNFEIIVKVLLPHRAEIRHPRPILAARFAVLSAVSTLEMAVLEPGSLWPTMLPLSDRRLCDELARSIVAYLVAPRSRSRVTRHSRKPAISARTRSIVSK